MALTQSIALIQGPPGTGKTFLALQIMRHLVANRQRGDPPILVMCLTNHALDQFLEGVLGFGEENIVRVGARCCRCTHPSLLVCPAHCRMRMHCYKHSNTACAQVEERRAGALHHPVARKGA